MNIQQIRYFLHLANTENMKQSADELFISQPALSKSISNLEEGLAAKLFDRVGRGIQLNKYGKLFQQRAYRAMNELEIVQKELYALTNAENGRIDLGFVYSLGPVFIPNLLANYAKKSHAKIRVSQNNTINLLTQLQDGAYDVAFFTGNEQFSTFAQFPDLEIIPIHIQPVIFIASLNSPLSSDKYYTLEELITYDFITFHEPSTLRPLINRYFAKKKMVPNISYEVLDDLTLLSLTSKNLGIGIFPQSSIMENFSVKEICLKEPFLTQTIYLAQNSLRYKSPAVQRFIDYIKFEKEDLLKHI
ncbi:LysR family transcriptional regulator [Enterococcus raffinosus]|uniref:LysR family transcriptional regulator n=1 Tax=Enterococcus raffinosus TaxID=71452 RepID=A0AAW8TAN3_9ENTE|nr:LysR family transcriptional regulator [Enterococcus raffinosus]MDT2522691.1 LysR family transcriptional regulator [Enterococcus raffinosus]MDT2529919.1 LysR family transcriptional regulator [Enterococcus raffinosus]MDT2532943.1 LysR family transcriptional regulator [Enterococcus raffinosus]MDT2543872.1 LysR family transcriptional regulator [Enterococcus raffinosus]MDT2554989.1 LysR family transcriptional regulator [Enterococcus raffinosus]